MEMNGNEGDNELNNSVGYYELHSILELLQW